MNNLELRELSHVEEMNINGGSVEKGFAVILGTVVACGEIIGASALTTVSVATVAAVVVGVTGALIGGVLIGQGN